MFRGVVAASHSYGQFSTDRDTDWVSLCKNANLGGRRILQQQGAIANASPDAQCKSVSDVVWKGMKRKWFSPQGRLQILTRERR